MADLNIPNLNMKSDKYIFKKKLSLRRKSKKRLFFEAAFMLMLSLFLIYINYLIPNKNLLMQNLTSNLNKTLILVMDLISILFQISLLAFIFISSITALVLLIGSFYRIFKIAKRKTKQINYN